MKFIITKSKNLRHSKQLIFEQIKQTKGKICIIVPDKLSVTIEKQLFEYLNICASFDIEVITMTRLSQKILTELDITYTPISKLGSIILLKKILTEKKDELRMFNSPSFSYNYSDTLFRTIVQFKASNISSEDMDWEKISSPSLQNKIYDLSIILKEYENQKAGLIDACDRLNMFALNINKSETIKNTNFFFLGFDDFTAQGYSVIEQLIKNSLCVNVAVYSNKSYNKNNYINEVQEHLISIAYNQNLPLEFYENDYTDDNIHSFLADNLLSIKQSNLDLNSNAIQLFNGKNFIDEIEYIARDIRQKVINGSPFKDFGVAVYELEKYKDQIKSTFEKYELSYYIDSSSSLLNTSYFKFFVNYTSLFVNNFQLENIIQLINSEFIEFPIHIKTKLNQTLKEINFSGNLKYLNLDEEFDSYLDFLKTLINDFEIKPDYDINNLTTIFNSLKSHLNIDEKLEFMANSCTDIFNKKILMQAPNSFNLLLDEITRFYPSCQVKDILDILKSGAKEQQIKPIPQSIDCVQVLDASEIMTDFDQLYIANCTHSTSPSLIQDIGIILDKDIHSLEFKNKLSPTISHLNKLAKFKTLNSFQMFNNNLTISMSIHSSSEQSDIVKDLINRVSINSTPIEVSEIENTTHSYKALTKWDLIEFVSKTKIPESSEILKTYGLANFSLTNNLSNETLSNINFNEISCSALENYFKCPMLYYLNNTLRLKQERQQGIAMVDVGNMIHDLAENFYHIKDRNNLDIYKFCINTLEKYMNSDKKLASFINTPIYINLINEAYRFLNHLKYLDKNCEFVPSYFEFSFDKNSKLNFPISTDVYLRGKIDRIDLYGDYIRIIDYKTGNVDASLKDLYYGKKLQLFLYANLAQKLFNKKLAGTFYLPVKNSILSDESIAPYKLTGFYLNNNDLITAYDKNILTTRKSNLMNMSLKTDNSIKVDSRSTKILTPNKFQDLLNYSKNVSNKAIGEIKSGYIAPSPIKFDEQSNSCNYCPYLAVCRKNSMNVKYRNVHKITLNNFGGKNE